MQPILRRVVRPLVFALALPMMAAATPAFAEHIDPGVSPEIAGVVLAGALGESETLASAEHALEKAGAGATLTPAEHAALWHIGLRWDGHVLALMGAERVADAGLVLRVLASLHAPSRAYQRVLVASARVLVQAEITRLTAVSAEILANDVEARTADLRRMNAELVAARERCRGLDAALREKNEAIERALAQLGDAGADETTRSRARAFVEEASNEAKSIAAELARGRSELLARAAALSRATDALTAEVSGGPSEAYPDLGPAKRAALAHHAELIGGLRHKAERLATLAAEFEGGR